MRIFYFLIALAIICICISCERNINDGKVIYKKIIPAHKNTYCTYIIVGKTHIPQWHTVNVEDKFILTVVNIKDNDTVFKDVEVNKSTFITQSINSRYKWQ